MKIVGDELKEKNYYISFFNTEEQVLKSATNRMRQVIDNPYAVVKKKNHEMEDFFYDKGKNYYTETKLGPIIKDYLILLLTKSIEKLYKVIILENAITIYGRVNSNIKNPMVKQYHKAIDQIKNFEIDETLPQKLASFLTEERFEEEKESISQDLIELGYENASDKVEEIETIIKKKNEKQKNKNIGKKV